MGGDYSTATQMRQREDSGPMHQVYMRFEKRVGWRVTFRDRVDDSIRFREFTFADQAQIREIVARSASRMLLEDSSAFEYGLKNGAGVVLLTLTQEQYRKLCR